MTGKHNELKKWIKKNYKHYYLFAKFLGYNRVSLSYKLNNFNPFTLEDIQRIKDKHHLTNDEIVLFFFK